MDAQTAFDGHLHPWRSAVEDSGDNKGLSVKLDSEETAGQSVLDDPGSQAVCRRVQERQGVYGLLGARAGVEAGNLEPGLFISLLREDALHLDERVDPSCSRGTISLEAALGSVPAGCVFLCTSAQACGKSLRIPWSRIPPSAALSLGTDGEGHA